MHHHLRSGRALALLAFLLVFTPIAQASTNFPASLDTTGTTLPNPASTDGLNAAGNLAHHIQHDNENDALRAIETKFGTGTSTPVANGLLAGTDTGISAWTRTPTVVGVGIVDPAVNATPSVYGATSTTTGIGMRANQLNLIANNILAGNIDNSGNLHIAPVSSHPFQLDNSSPLVWSSNGSAGDVGISRTAAGVLGVGNGTQGDATGNLQLNKVTKYAAVTTAGLGVPAIYGYGRTVGTTTAVVNGGTYTVGAADGDFEVSENVLVTTSTTHNFTGTISYTNSAGTARTLTENFSSTAGTIATAITNAGGTDDYAGMVTHIRAKASTTITCGTTGSFASVVYNLDCVIKQTA